MPSASMSLWNRREAAPVAFASIAGLLIVAAARSLFDPPKARLLRAPEPTEKEPYPWNLYEGGATLQTPYGKLRLYETGPKEGRKVLLIHGISQPCPLWRRVIPKLVESGHRILCYDLVGRGYSDGPAHMDYDVSLYVSQICMLLTSLPDWSGSFSIVGYSLGGVVATSFASYFPHRVDNLLLLCPAGLMKPDSLSGLTRLFCSGQVSTSFVQSLVSSGVQKTKFLVATDMVQWQLKHHDAFPYAFASSLASGNLANLSELFQQVQDLFGDRMQAIWGDKDVTCPLDGARGISGLKVHIVEGAAHDMIQRPEFSDKVAHLMCTFLSSSM